MNKIVGHYLLALNLTELQVTQQYQGASEVSREGEGVRFHSLGMVYDYEGKVVTLDELEHYTPVRSFTYRKIKKIATSKARKLKSLSKVSKEDGDSCTVRVLVAFTVRSHWVKMAFLAPSHFPGPVRRKW